MKVTKVALQQIGLLACKETTEDMYNFIQHNRLFSSSTYCTWQKLLLMYPQLKPYLYFTTGPSEALLFDRGTGVMVEFHPQINADYSYAQFQRIVEVAKVDPSVPFTYAPKVYQEFLLKYYLHKVQNPTLKRNLILQGYAMQEYSFDIPLYTKLLKQTQQVAQDLDLLVTQGYNQLESTLVVYRGEGRLSTPYQDALSWTLSYQTATYFATRFGKQDARVYQGFTDLSSILAYLPNRGEAEVLIEAKNIKNIKQIGI